MEDEKEELLKKKLEAATKEIYEKVKRCFDKRARGPSCSLEELKKKHELEREKLANDHEEDFR